MYTPPYPNTTELLAADERGEVSVELLDDVLWYFMTARDGPYEQPNKFPEPVRNYVASRLMEWEVGNGGFSQAAYNIPEWFDAAAKGYEAIGLSEAAQRIRQAKTLMESNTEEFTRGPDATIEKVFSEFADSDLAALDDGLDEIGWWAIEKRVAYVRAHRSAFKGAV
jgi:hypothetical protein